MESGFSTYQKINTMGMSQLDLILAVYRGAIGYLDQAKAAYADDRLADGRTACGRARKCMVHLYTTLDMEKGGMIATRLGQLYAFMIERIDLAVASKSIQLIEDVIGILGTIKEGWESLKDQEAKTDVTPGDSGKAAGANNASPDSSLAGNRVTLSA